MCPDTENSHQAGKSTPTVKLRKKSYPDDMLFDSKKNHKSKTYPLAGSQRKSSLTGCRIRAETPVIKKDRNTFTQSQTNRVRFESSIHSQNNTTKSNHKNAKSQQKILTKTKLEITNNQVLISINAEQSIKTKQQRRIENELTCLPNYKVQRQVEALPYYSAELSHPPISTTAYYRADPQSIESIHSYIETEFQQAESRIGQGSCLPAFNYSEGPLFLQLYNFLRYSHLQNELLKQKFLQQLIRYPSQFFILPLSISRRVFADTYINKMIPNLEYRVTTIADLQYQILCDKLKDKYSIKGLLNKRQYEEYRLKYQNVTPNQIRQLASKAKQNNVSISFICNQMNIQTHIVYKYNQLSKKLREQKIDFSDEMNLPFSNFRAKAEDQLKKIEKNKQQHQKILKQETVILDN